MDHRLADAKVPACRGNEICGHLELFGLSRGAVRWSEKIRIDPPKLPPRANEDEPRCGRRIALTAERVDDAADPGAYVKEHALQRDNDAQIVHSEAGNYSKKACWTGQSAPGSHAA